MEKQFRVSRNSPAYYLTSVAKDRLPVFRTDAIGEVACKAINEARMSGGFLIFAYVIMPDHIHLVTDNSKEPKEILRFVNGIVSRRIIDHLDENNYAQSLEKLRVEEKAKGYKYSLWQHHPDTRLLWNEELLIQRINYTHLNPVRAGLVEKAVDWRFSSARIWQRCHGEDEPLAVDIERIAWQAERGTASKSLQV